MTDDEEQSKKSIAIVLLFLSACAFIIVVVLLLSVYAYLYIAFSSFNSILACEHVGANNAEKVNEIENRTEISKYTSFATYSNLTQKNKELFKEALREEDQKPEQARPDERTTELSRDEMSGFLPTPGRAGTRYIAYEGEIYACGDISQRGVA
jgi:hypothetical protein